MEKNFLYTNEWRMIREKMKELFEIEESNCDRKPEYWHYTTLKTLDLILGDELKKFDYFGPNNITKLCFYASNIRYLNDEQEFKDGVRELRKLSFYNDNIVDDKCMDNVFLISFCGDGDLLSQWKYYGKESGIAVKLNLEYTKYRYWKCIDSNISKEIPEEIKTLSNSKSKCEYFDELTRPLRVRYNDNEKKRFYTSLVYEDNTKPSPLLFNLFVPFCKHNGFSEENESRLVFFANRFSTNEYNNTKIVPDIEYNYGKSTVKPSLRVQMEPLLSNKQLIEQIIVGPGYNQNLVFNALIHIFDRSNYHFNDINDTMTEKDNSNIILEEFISSQSDYKVHRVDICQNNKVKTREAYKCENGMIIMKSSIPFRGD